MAPALIAPTAIAPTAIAMIVMAESGKAAIELLAVVIMALAAEPTKIRATDGDLDHGTRRTLGAEGEGRGLAGRRQALNL